MKKIVVLLVAVLAVAGCKREEKTATPKKVEQTATGIEPGFRLPDYEATNLDGSKFELASRKDKVVLVNLWATWCGPCRIEIPELQRIHNQYAGRGFEVLGVSVDEGDVESVRQFVTDEKMTYPIVLDPQGKMANLLQTSMLPTSIMLDRQGKIDWKHIGLIEPNDAELKAAIEKAL